MKSPLINGSVAMGSPAMGPASRTSSMVRKPLTETWLWNRPTMADLLALPLFFLGQPTRKLPWGKTNDVKNCGEILGK